MSSFGFIEALEDRQLLSAAPIAAHGVRVSAVEGAAFAGVDVAAFKDKTPDSVGAYTATITWGDGSSSGGTVLADGAGGFVVNGAHTYVARGVYRTSVQIADMDGDSAKAASRAKVQDAAIVVTGKDISGISGLAIQAVVATYTDADPRSATGPVAGQLAAIRWGDGKSSPGTIALNSSTHLLEVTGKHAYAKAGIFSVITIIREGGVPPSRGTPSNATVVAPIPAISPSLVGDYTGTAKAGGGGGFFDNLIGDAVGKLSFEFHITSQSLTSVTGSISVDGNAVTGDFPGSLLSNRKFHFVLADTQGSIDVAGRVNATGLAMSGRITAKYSGLSILKFSGEFSATRH